MPEVTKGELDMIASVADTGTAEANESSFLRRSGRLTKTQAAPVVETPLSKEDTAQAAIMPNPARRIAAMKSKVTTTAGRKISAKVELSIEAKTLIITGLTGDDIAMADTQKFSEAIATKATKIISSAGRNSSTNRQNTPIAVEQVTRSNTGDSDAEMSGVIDDTNDSDFVPELTLSDKVTSGLPSHTRLGGALPASPPASDDVSSPSKKRKTNRSDSEIGSPKKRSKSPKKSAKAKPSAEEQLIVRPKRPSPHGKPLVWAEVSLIIFSS